MHEGHSSRLRGDASCAARSPRPHPPPVEVGRGTRPAEPEKPPRAKLGKLGAASRACGLGWLGCCFLARGASRAGVLGLGVGVGVAWSGSQEGIDRLMKAPFG